MAETRMSDAEFSFGYWWVTHRGQLRKTSGITLVIIHLLLITTLVIQGVSFVFEVMRTADYFETMAQPDIAYADVRNKQQPQNIQLGATQVFDSDLEGRVNIATEITNPNEHWAVKKITYSAVVNGELQSPETDFLMAQERHFITTFGIEAASAGQVQATLNVTDVEWERVNAYTTPKGRIDVTDIEFSPSITVEDATSSDQVFSQATADITNRDIFTFAEAEFIVVAEIQGDIIAVRRIMLKDLIPSETQTLRAQWSRRISPGAEVSVLTHINLIDKTNRKLSLTQPASTE